MRIVDHGHVLRHQVSHQLLATRPRPGDYRRFANGRMTRQLCLDFTEFDAVATHLHLLVDSPEVFHHTLGPVTRQVAGAVKPFTAPGERVGDETLGGQPWPLVIPARQARPANQQLAGNANRHWRQVLTQQVEPGIVHWPA
ncbi:hypothetical protein D9M73_219260 [compost metagenome]